MTSPEIKPSWRTHPFQPGQRIQFAGSTYIVVANHGSSGLVYEEGYPDEHIKFAWNFEGEDCVACP